MARNGNTGLKDGTVGAVETRRVDKRGRLAAPLARALGAVGLRARGRRVSARVARKRVNFNAFNAFVRTSFAV